MKDFTPLQDSWPLEALKSTTNRKKKKYQAGANTMNTKKKIYNAIIVAILLMFTILAMI
jgi:hypothetical protein